MWNIFQDCLQSLEYFLNSILLKEKKAVPKRRKIAKSFSMQETEPSEEYLQESVFQLSRSNSGLKEEKFVVEKSHLQSLLSNKGEKAIEIFSSRFNLSLDLLSSS